MSEADSLPPCEVLRDMMRTKQTLLPTGEQVRRTSSLSAEHASALYNVILNEKPHLVVEIGMAQGVSTLSILCALHQTGGQLISIDPYVDWKSGRNAALYAVERAGYADHHSHIEDMSEKALPALFKDGKAIDFGYIDGCHHFEHAFNDFFYLDRMLNKGCVLGFNDAGKLPVHRVIRYLQKERDYEELDVGLKCDYSARSPLHSLGRRIFNVPRQDRYFRKLS